MDALATTRIHVRDLLDATEQVRLNGRDEDGDATDDQGVSVDVNKVFQVRLISKI